MLKARKNAPSKEWKIGACNVEDLSSSVSTLEETSKFIKYFVGESFIIVFGVWAEQASEAKYLWQLSFCGTELETAGALCMLGKLSDSELNTRFLFFFFC